MQIIDVANSAGVTRLNFKNELLIRFMEKSSLIHIARALEEHQKGSKSFEFGKDEYKSWMLIAKKVELVTSAWDLDSQKFLRQFDLNYNKVASAMIVNNDLLRLIAGKAHFISGYV